MIWLIIGALPIVILFGAMLINDPQAWIISIATTAVVVGGITLAYYGAWQMNWFNHCGDFWQSFDCTGKVITN